MRTVLALVVVLTSGSVASWAQEQTPKKVRGPAGVRITKTEVTPNEIHTGQKPKVGTAVVLVTIFHQAIPEDQPQTVKLEVGTSSAVPAPANAKYTPSIQTVTLSGSPGIVYARVTVSGPTCPSGHATCTITVWPSLADPSPGLTIWLPDPPTDAQATLTIVNP
jgi:hypothetical protein